MPSPQKILSKKPLADAAAIAGAGKRKVNAALRRLNYKEVREVPSRGEYEHLDFAGKMQMLNLPGEDFKPAFGRPAWRPEFDPKAEAQHELDVMIAELDLQEYEKRRQYEERELEHHWRQKLEPEFRAKYQPVATPPAASPLPQPVPQRVSPGELRLVRNAVNQIAAAEAEGVSMRVTSRRDGRIAAISITPDDGPPCRVVAKRDRAGQLIGLTMEDR